MSRRRIGGLVAAVLAASTIAGAQIVVFDPATVAQNAAIAALKEQLSRLLSNEVDQLRQMARRLSAFADLQRYGFHDTPEWRIHLFLFEQYLFANRINASLNYGDRSGAGFGEVARERVEPGTELAALGAEDQGALDAVRAQLATLDLGDSTIVAGIDQNGQLRYNGRKELEAIEALQSDVLDPSESQSTAAVLDKVNAAGLIRARQQQARLQFLSAIVEQMLVDNKRSRDTEAAVMNMRLEALRDGRAAGAAVIAGAADDLRTWRQP
jgi:hypothetical protein